MAALSSLVSSRIKNKTVLLRIDSDVDIRAGRILDDTRLLSSIESIRTLQKNKCNIILVGHLGRPEGRDRSWSLHPIAKWYSQILHQPLQEHSSPFGGWKIGKSIVLLENIRFFDEEEQNDKEFSKQLANLADVFVNEAFAVAHREHASTVGVARILPSYAGIHFTKEIHTLEKVMNNPNRPLAVLIGGAKIETKLPMVEKMHAVADFVLVGGEVADHAKELMKVQHARSTRKRSIILVADLIDSGLDITMKSAQNFIQVLNTAKTIVWNGPVGKTGHNPLTEQGTRLIAHALAHSPAYTVVGGGDTVSYLRQNKMLDKFSFISTGGGAMLELLSGKKLPAYEVLRR